MSQPTRILFICLGNIVRSPLGEAMFRQLADQAGVGEKYEVDSAGTAAYHTGESPDSRMRLVAREYGLIYDGAARQVRPSDLDEFDLIIPMDSSNKANLLNLARSEEQRAKIHMMREFDPESPPNANVPDPYYGGLDGFHQVYYIVERSAKRLLEALENGEL